MNNTQLLTIIAGPCSVDEQNINEIYELSQLQINGRKILAGTRLVGLKSRTKLDRNSWMGLDFQILMQNLNILNRGGSIDNLLQLPSFDLASKVSHETGMIIASEIMLPGIQMPLLDRAIGKNQALTWNPSVNQLGWQVLEMSQWASKNNWTIGLKNGKTFGQNYDTAEDPSFNGQTSIETVWPGLASYAENTEVVFIHRGVDVPEKGDYRNMPNSSNLFETKGNQPKLDFLLGSKSYPWT